MNFLKGSYKNKRLARQLLMFLALLLFGLLLGAVATVLLAHLPCSTTLRLEWTQLLSSIALFILPALAMAYLLDTNAAAQRTNARYYLLAILIILSALPFINLLTSWNESITFPDSLAPLENYLKTLEQKAQTITEQFLRNNTWGGFLLNLVVMALVAAIGEELTFRGILQNLFAKKWNIHLAVWLTALIFSTVHLQFYGFFPRMLLGVILGYLAVWSGSLYPAIIAHFCNNALAVCYYFIQSRHADITNLDTIGTGAQWWLALLSLLCTATLIYLLWKNRVKPNDAAREQ